MLSRRSALVFVLGAIVIIALSATYLSQPILDADSARRGAARARRSPASPLRFRDDGSFQIAIFEDLHFGENAWEQWGPQQDLNSVRVMEAVLDAEGPDLVVLNGDLITGENTFRENSTAYLDQIAAPMVRRALPWASTYGNHDSDFNLSRAALLAREQQAWPGLARTANMLPGVERAGVTNYYLPVYGSDCPAAASTADQCVPRLLLWFFDSRGGFGYQQKNAATGQRVGQENWVDASAVAWFEQTQAALHAKYAQSQYAQHASSPVVLPSLAFVHIPPNVAYALQMSDAGDGDGVDPHRQPGINDDRPLAQQAQGWCPDGSGGGGATPATIDDCAYGGQDEPFMRAIAAAGNGTGVIALFSGHDHGDTWCHTWDDRGRNRSRTLPGVGVSGTGVHLCFGQHSGYGGYGTWTRGARQVRVAEESLKRAASVGSRGGGGRRADVDTWIRLETGDVVGAVTLNATYGRDVYPATPNTHTRCPTCHDAVTSGAASTRKRPSFWGSSLKTGSMHKQNRPPEMVAGTEADAGSPMLRAHDWARYLLGWPPAP